VGIVPPSLLLDRNIDVQTRKFPSDEGMLPVKLLKLMSSDSKFDRPPREEGIDPVKPIVDNVKPVTTPPEQVTPIHEVVPQIAVAGTLDVQDQTVYNVMLLILVAATILQMIRVCND